MNRPLRVVLASPILFPNAKKANLVAMAEVLANERGENADLFVFPEVNIIGGFSNDSNNLYARLAEMVPEGDACQAVCRLAQNYHTTICSGIVEECDGQYYITHFLCGPGGYVGKQRKLIPHDLKKKQFFARGDTLEALELFGHRCVVLACADVLLPEASILPSLAKASLIISPMDCFDETNRQVVKRLISARAMDAGAYAVAAFGHDPNHPEDRVMAGLAVNPAGDVIASPCRTAAEGMTLKVELDLEEPNVKWGGVAARQDTLLKLLQTSASQTSNPSRAEIL
jgi:predicted amidohydrolase